MSEEERAPHESRIYAFSLASARTRFWRDIRRSLENGTRRFGRPDETVTPLIRAAGPIKLPLVERIAEAAELGASARGRGQSGLAAKVFAPGFSRLYTPDNSCSST
jgi:hypothetical protein